VATGESVKVTPGVAVPVGISISTSDETGIAVGSVLIEAPSSGKNWLTTGSPKIAEATVEELKMRASKSHCQPAAM
jgi:hypothetical protein